VNLRLVLVDYYVRGPSRDLELRACECTCERLQ